MKKFKVYIITFIIFIFPNLVKAKVEIKYKIGEQIITNIDILNEKNYLIFLRPDLKNISNKKIIEIAENSLIREIIKKNELNEVFDINEADKYINKVKKNLYRFTNVNNENDLKKLLKRNNIEYENKPCCRILKTGKNKGQPCNKNCKIGYMTCSRHT